MSAQLTFDELDFLPLDTRAALARDGFYFEVGSDETTWGNAPAVVSSLLSEMFEGASVEVTGYEGVVLPVMVRVVGMDSAAVATGTAVLVSVLRREAMKALTYSPPDGTAPPTVFDVLVATWDHKYDDEDEVQKRPRRAYLLKLYCKPFSRSADLVTVPAVTIATVAPTIASIDACSSTTGWSTTSKAVSRINLIRNGTFRYGIQEWGRGAGTSSISWSGGGYMAFRGANRTDRSHVNNLTQMSVVAGQSYRIQMDLWQSSGVSQLGVLIRWHNSSGAQIGSDASNVVTTSLGTLGTKSWRTLSTARTAPSGAVKMNIFPYAIFGHMAGSETHSNINNVHVELNSTWSSVFDGDTAAAGTTEYAWSGSVGRSISYALTPATPTTSSGRVNVTAYGGRSLSLRRSGTISMITAQWLRLRGIWSGALTLNVEVTGGGFVPPIAPQVVVREGSTFDAYFHVTVDSITAFSLATDPGSASLQSATLSVDQVDTSTGPPLTGTGRSGDFSAVAHGTMPAEAAITVANAADLGRMVLLYTRPASLATVHPALRSRRIAGPSVAAASGNISGFSETLATSQAGAVTWEIDAVDLPASAYVLAARLTATGLTSGNGYTLNWRAYMVLDGATETHIVTGSRTIKATATTYGNVATQRITEIGLLGLPTQNVFTSGDASAKVRIQVWVTGGGTWSLDESWIFDTDKGDFSIVEPVSPLHRLTVTPASADRPVQTYVAEHEPSPGNITARDVHLDVTAWSSHKVDPRDGELAIYVATLTDTPALSAEVEYYPRWDVYAAPIEVEETA